MNIIILDDSPTIRITLTAYLNKLGVLTQEIHSFENGNLALDYIKKSGVDLIFSDIHMPLMNGCEFAEEVLTSNPEIRDSFFVISGDMLSDACDNLKKIGIENFFKKPVRFEDFSNLVQPKIEKYRALLNNKGE